MEKYICNNCGVDVKCTSWELAISRGKMCVECCGKKRMGIDTVRRINARANLLGLKVDGNHMIIKEKGE